MFRAWTPWTGAGKVAWPVDVARVAIAGLWLGTTGTRGRENEISNLILCYYYYYLLLIILKKKELNVVGPTARSASVDLENHHLTVGPEMTSATSSPLAD